MRRALRTLDGRRLSCHTCETCPGPFRPSPRLPFLLTWDAVPLRTSTTAKSLSALPCADPAGAPPKEVSRHRSTSEDHQEQALYAYHPSIPPLRRPPVSARPGPEIRVGTLATHLLDDGYCTLTHIAVAHSLHIHRSTSSSSSAGRENRLPHRIRRSTPQNDQRGEEQRHQGEGGDLRSRSCSCVATPTPPCRSDCSCAAPSFFPSPYFYPVVAGRPREVRRARCGHLVQVRMRGEASVLDGCRRWGEEETEGSSWPPALAVLCFGMIKEEVGTPAPVSQHEG